MDVEGLDFERIDFGRRLQGLSRREWLEGLTPRELGTLLLGIAAQPDEVLAARGAPLERLGPGWRDEVRAEAMRLLGRPGTSP
jgi:hypothetical protein